MTETATTNQNQISTAGEVKQQELLRLIEIRNKISTLEAEKSQLEEEVKNRIVAGAKIESGTFLCELKTTMVRRPSWKDELIAFADKVKGAGAGVKLAAKITENTEPVPSVQLKIK
jgi:hypothetical protein